MCPTFIATGEEIMSTRGRANIIRAALELRFGVRQHVAAFKSVDMSAHSKDPLRSAELDAALTNCLSCKGCTPECPSNVNLALLKAEMLYARHQRDGLPLRERIFSSVDLLGRLGCATPRFANAIADLKPVRALMEKALGISAKRSLPHYASERFDRWFEKRAVAALYERRTNKATVADRRYRRGRVILWDDTFVRYHEPRIGIAAVKVLEALGFEVSLLKNRQCCGRPAFSQGNLDAATRVGKHNIDLLNSLSSQLSTNPPSPSYGAASNSQQSAPPILFLEPSCWSMFVDDYRELKIDNAEKVAARCFLFEKFIDDLLDREPDAVQFKNGQATVAIHPHCHAKSLMNPAFMARLVERLPGRKAQLLDTGCCGMAGAFGALAEKYDLSIQVAKDLLDKIANEQPDVVVASGTSCRHQISDLTGFHPKHMAELIAEAIA
jgi:Fe-S oxidoreductase